MKTKKGSLVLPLLTITLLFVLSGCYTQLAIVDDEQYSVNEPTTIIIIEHVPPFPGPCPKPYWDPPIPDPVFHPLPPAGSIQNDNEQKVQTPTRESGIQRGERNETPQLTSRTEDRRTSGPTRGGR